MKKILFSALAAAFLLGACSKEGGENNKPEGQEASITIKLDASTVSKTRAFDQREGTEQNRVKLDRFGYVFIYFFDGAGNLVGDEQGVQVELITSTGKTFGPAESITNAVRKVVVVGNVETGAMAFFGNNNVTKEADLLNYFKSATELDALVNGAGHFWVSGESGITWTGVDVSGVEQGNATLSLSPIFARIDVKVNIADAQEGFAGFHKDHTVSAVTLKSVDILYGGTYGNFVTEVPSAAQLLAAGKAPYYLTSGIVPTNDAYWNAWTTNGMRANANQLVNTGELRPTTSTIGDAGANNFVETVQHGNYSTAANLEGDYSEFTKSFYVFANPADAQKSVTITLYGVHHNVAANVALQDKTWFNAPTFWSVFFDGSSATRPTLENGNIYTITMNLKGDYSPESDDDEDNPGEPGGGGNPDPEEPSKDANIIIIVDKSEWNAIVDMGEENFDE